METAKDYNMVPVEEIIPQRRPFVMIDKLVDVSDNSAITEFHVEADNIFVDQGYFVEAGMVENMAQTCAAGMGYINTYSVKDQVRVGFLSAIRNLKIMRLPKTGEVLRTRVSIIKQFMGMVLVEARSFVGDEEVAQGEMKIFIVDSDEDNR